MTQLSQRRSLQLLLGGTAGFCFPALAGGNATLSGFDDAFLDDLERR